MKLSLPVRLLLLVLVVTIPLSFVASTTLFDLTRQVQGILPVANGGTGANLSATGGTSQVLKQVSTGAGVTVGQLGYSNLSGLADCDPLNMTTVCLAEEFTTNNTTNGQIGALGWAYAQIVGTTSSVAVNFSTALPHMGLVIPTTQAVSGDGLWFALYQGGNYSFFGALGATAGWDSYFEFALATATANAAITRFGMISNNGSLTNVIPVLGGAYWRIDPTLESLTSATYTSGGSVTGTIGQTCNAAFLGGTATATIALTGTNVIAGSTAFSGVSAGAGYNSAYPPTKATLTNGTATCSGSATIAAVLGAASSGGDTTIHLCSNTSGIEYCSDTTNGPDTNFHNLRVRSPSAAQINMSLDHAAEITFCAVGCTITTTPNSGVGWQPAFEVVSSTASTAEKAYIDFFRFKITGLSF